jgi:hypothetical protein
MLDTMLDDSAIHPLTYTHAKLPPDFFILDQWLAESPPLLSLYGEIPRNEGFGPFERLPVELWFTIFDYASVTDLMRLRQLT